jgi:hypothetical protein
VPAIDSRISVQKATTVFLVFCFSFLLICDAKITDCSFFNQSPIQDLKLTYVFYLYLFRTSIN